MNENKKNYLRAISAIELAAWTQHHLLKPVAPENDGLLPCMPWREDVEKFDDSTKGVFLDEPDDFDLAKPIRGGSQFPKRSSTHHRML